MVNIYILKLESNKYYIGKTNNPKFRIENHFNSNGSQWTKLYKPLELIELITNCDDYDEDKYTRIYMDKYGINNVRGGSFCSIELSNETINFLKIKKEIIEKPNENIYDLISLNSLITNSPFEINKKIIIIDNLEKLKKFKIKNGDLILNSHRNYYNNLKEIIEDAIDIYNNYEKFIENYNPHPQIDLKDIIKYIPNERIKFYKQISTLLSSFDGEIIKDLQSGIPIETIQLKIIENIRC
jgi:hypothetical protein